MKVIGYLRISTDKQDLDIQRHLLLDYAQNHKLIIEEFVEIEVSSQKDRKQRKIDELLAKLQKEDILLVAELSRLGRNMLETLNIINELSCNLVKIVFIRQPELSTVGSHAKLLLAIYSYFAEAERDYISIRTKQGLAATKAKGTILGRTKGSRNKKSRRLDNYNQQINYYLNLKISISAILKILNNQMEIPISYTALRYHIRHEPNLQTISANY